MLHNRFNPLFAAAEDAPPANPGTAAPAAPEKTEEGEKTGDAAAEGEPDPANPPAPETEPAAATAAAKPQLNAFQRGALRALGTGELVSRVEKAETQNVLDAAEIGRLSAENIRLTSELTKFKTEVPKQVADAKAGRANEVSQGVRAELTMIGINEADAPSLTGESEANKTKTRAEFDALDHPARNTFMRNGGKIEG